MDRASVFSGSAFHTAVYASLAVVATLATTAVLEELVDFFPQGKRQLLRKALAKLETLQETMLAVVSERLDSPELDAQLLAELRKLGDSSGDSPASSESTPVP